MIGNRRRGVDNFEDMVPGDAKVRVVELQCVRFGQEFLGKECVVAFQKLKTLLKMASWSPLVMLEIQWLMGGAGNVATEEVEVDLFSTEVKF